MPKPKHKPLDAIKLLKEDHEYVKKALRAFEKMDHEDHAALEGLVSQVCTALKVHTKVEEELFYPAAPIAQKHGAAAEKDTPSPEEAYAPFGERDEGKPPSWNSLPWA